MVKRVKLMATTTALAAVLACGGGAEDGDMRFSGEEVDAARSSWSPVLAAAVDSGNTAYRQGRYEEARRRFAEATERFPHTGAVWFGLYMAEHALGNIEAADSALARAEYLTPGFEASAPAMTDGDSSGQDSVPGGDPVPGRP